MYVTKFEGNKIKVEMRDMAAQLSFTVQFITIIILFFTTFVHILFQY